MVIKKIFLISVVAFILILALFFLTRKRLDRSYDTKKPNILLVTVCSLRKDHLGCYGYQRNTSPNIDKFTKTSTLFYNCYTHIPWTKPSIIALMTGKYPTPHIDIEKETTLPEILHSYGYVTCGVIGSSVIRDEARTNNGFDFFWDNRDLETNKDLDTVKSNIVVEKAIDFLNKHQKNKMPVFLWLFFKDPHWKYLPTTPYNERFLYDSLFTEQTQQLIVNDDYNDSIDGIGEARLIDSDRKYITNKAVYISQYDGEISFMDTNFGRIINYIRETMNLDDWMIIFIADHGESLGEDGYFFDHGYKLSEGLVNIPLIIKFPAQKRKTEINKHVSICDIYPTIIDLLGLSQKIAQHDIFSRSLLKNWKKIFKEKERLIMLKNSPHNEKKKEELFGCIWHRYKLIWDFSSNEKNLYNLAKKDFLVVKYNKKQQKIVHKVSGFIMDFFIKKNNIEYNTSDMEELKSLGYIQ